MIFPKFAVCSDAREFPATLPRPITVTLDNGTAGQPGERERGQWVIARRRTGPKDVP